MKKIGFPLQFDKKTKLQEEINKIVSDDKVKKSVKDIIKYEMINLLEAADYFKIG
jgi:hypothetical protein